MWPDAFAALPPLWLIFGAFLIAGTVKGIAAVGLPMTALGILTTQTDPRTAITLSLVPIFLANLWQFLNAGGAVAAIRRYFPFLAALVVGIPVTLTLTVNIDQRVLTGVLGGVFVAFVALNVTRWKPAISDERDIPAQLGFGAIGGVLGGLVSIWLPAIVVYLSARQTNKDEFVRATALMLFAGILPLIAGFWREGYLTGPLTGLSAALVIPTVIGMAAGTRLRNRLSEQAFRNVLMVVFVLIGLNLIRKSLTG